MTSEPERSPHHAHEWRVFPAIVIVAIGVLFLLNNLGMRFTFPLPDNWWAWVILVAAIAPLSRAYQAYQARGKFDPEVAHSLLSGAAVVLVAVMFLADLDWGIWWPLFVILGGLFSLVRRPDCRRRHSVNGQRAEDATSPRN